MSTKKMLDLFWWATFNDESKLHQYSEDGEETPFQEVLDRQDKLKYFTLTRRKDGLSYIVDLENGYISITKLGSNIFKPRHDMLRKDAYKYRLIYFREVERTFAQNLEELSEPSVIYFIGFQFTDKNGSNNKRMMKIHENGELVVN